MELHDDNKGEWSYSPEWFSAEDDKGNSTNRASTDAPAKGLNTRPPGDNSPTPVNLPPPVTNPPTSDGHAPEPTSISAEPPASSPSQAPTSCLQEPATPFCINDIG